MTKDHREQNGRFSVGNPGGPGRPRRAIEREYLQALADTVPLDTWKEIVQKAVEDAKQGDGKARDWLTKYLIGPEPPSLLDLAVIEIEGSAERDFLQKLSKRLEDWGWQQNYNSNNLEQARKVIARFEKVVSAQMRQGKEEEAQTQPSPIPTAGT